MVIRRTSPFLVIFLALAQLSCRALAGGPPGAAIPPPAVSAPAGSMPYPPHEPQPLIEAPPAIDLTTSQETLIHLYEATPPGDVSVRVLTQGDGGLGSGFVLNKRPEQTKWR